MVPGPLMCTSSDYYPGYKPNITAANPFNSRTWFNMCMKSDYIAYVSCFCRCINWLNALGAAVSRGRCSPPLLYTHLSGVWVHVSFLSALHLSQYWLLSATEKLILYPHFSVNTMYAESLHKYNHIDVCIMGQHLENIRIILQNKSP